jgi:GT2 family glycosyltransferase
MAMTPEHLHAIVLGYGNGGEHLELMRSLIKEGISPEHLLLVHNPSASGRGPIPPDAGRVISLSKNRGYAGAMNVAVRESLLAGAECVLLLTHDARLHAGALAKLGDAADQHPRHGILGPVLWSRGEDKAWSYGGEGFAPVPGTQGRPPVAGRHRVTAPTAHSGPIAQCDWVDGSAMLVRRAVFDEVGLLDERYFMYLEETDLCMRAGKAGWKVGVVLAARAEQSPGAPSRPGAYAYLTARNGLDFARSARGPRAAAELTVRLLGWIWRLVKWYVKHGRDPRVRREVHPELVGTLAGMAHFLLRRWGPPPQWLPGLGDVER